MLLEPLRADPAEVLRTKREMPVRPERQRNRGDRDPEHIGHRVTVRVRASAEAASSVFFRSLATSDRTRSRYSSLRFRFFWNRARSPLRSDITFGSLRRPGARIQTRLRIAPCDARESRRKAR